MANLQNGDGHYAFMGNHYNEQHGWNRKLCFEARDTLFQCTDSLGGNKFKCPDELYAYEMWCPTDFRRMQSIRKRKADRDATLYSAEMLANLNSERAHIKKGTFVETKKM